MQFPYNMAPLSTIINSKNKRILKAKRAEIRKIQDKKSNIRNRAQNI